MNNEILGEMNIAHDEDGRLIPDPSAEKSPDFSSAVQPSYVRTVFLGPDGLKAGWGFAFYVAMYYLLQFFVLQWAASVQLGADGLWSMMLEEFGLFLAAVAPALWLESGGASVGSLRSAGAAGVWKIILGGRGLGIREHLAADGFDVWRASF